MNALSEIGKKEIHVVGLSIITTNELAQTQNTIGQLWEKFLNSTVKEKLTKADFSHVFSIYSHYENREKGKYQVTIGYAVADVNKIPDGLTLITIPIGNYKKFNPKSPMPADIIASWQEIWSTDSKVLPRNFIADFEVYNDKNEASIYVGVFN